MLTLLCPHHHILSEPRLSVFNRIDTLIQYLKRRIQYLNNKNYTFLALFEKPHNCEIRYFLVITPEKNMETKEEKNWLFIKCGK